MTRRQPAKGRPPNRYGTEKLTLSVNPLVRRYLDTLVEHGMWGKTANEAAELIISQRIAELSQARGRLAKSLDQTWQKYQKERKSKVTARGS